MSRPKIFCYFDTETTDLPRAAGTPLDQQPHIVQLAATLVDEKGEFASFNTIIKPDGWEVADGAAAIHGITTETALRHGVPVRVAMAFFSNFCRVADQIVAHNIDFDLKLVGFEFERLEVKNITNERPWFCTMHATENICKIPGKFGKYKWPKLIEAHEHFFGEGFDGAHDALVDVRACQRVHRHLLDNNLCKA